jgi:hypothetical protein
MVHDEGRRSFNVAKILDHSNIKMTEREAKLGGNTLPEPATPPGKDGSHLNERPPKVKFKATNVRVLYARETFTRFLSEAKLLKGLVARDGIEPPTPAFSGPRSTN